MRFSSLFVARQEGGVPGGGCAPMPPLPQVCSWTIFSLDLTVPVLAIVAFLTLLNESILVMTRYSSSCVYTPLCFGMRPSLVSGDTQPRGAPLDTLALASLAHTLALGERVCISHRSDGAWPEVCFNFSGILSSGRHGSSPKNGF